MISKNVFHMGDYEEETKSMIYHLSTGNIDTSISTNLQNMYTSSFLRI